MVIVFVLLVFTLLVQLVKGSVVFEVEHKFKGIGKRSPLSALKAHDTHRHARILSAVDLPLGGNGRPSDAALVFLPPSLSLDYYFKQLYVFYVV